MIRSLLQAGVSLHLLAAYVADSLIVSGSLAPIAPLIGVGLRYINLQIQYQYNYISLSDKIAISV